MLYGFFELLIGAICDQYLPNAILHLHDFLSQPFLKLEDLEPWFFPFPSDNYGISAGSNHDFMTDVYRVVLSSPVVLHSQLALI